MNTAREWFVLQCFTLQWHRLRFENNEYVDEDKDKLSKPKVIFLMKTVIKIVNFSVIL